jgi:uncharacterized MAPEG superfamily protein
MTIAFWAVLFACVLPVLCAGISKWGARGMDNAAPRAWIETQTGWRRRADWAQRNHQEALAPFAAAVIVAHLAHAPQGPADALAAAFIALRLAYTAAYILNRPHIRSLLWSVGFACVIGLFAIAA